MLNFLEKDYYHCFLLVTLSMIYQGPSDISTTDISQIWQITPKQSQQCK